MIYDNFVDRKAMHQINLPSAVSLEIIRIVMDHRKAVRLQTQRLCATYDTEENQGTAVADVKSEIDVNIFDEASSEIMSLLRSSFFRFAQTKQFKVYCTVLGKL